MSPLDTELEELLPALRRLSKRSLVGLFWACSIALLAEFRAWAVHRGVETEPLLHDILAAARRFSENGMDGPEPGAMLATLDEITPGESPDYFPSTAAQDCCICADVCIRVLVDETYVATPVIEYALNPVLEAATEELYGVSDVGSGPEEDTQLQAVLKHPKVAVAFDFVRWATAFLQDRPSPTDADLALVRSRASILLPR